MPLQIDFSAVVFRDDSVWLRRLEVIFMLLGFAPIGQGLRRGTRLALNLARNVEVGMKLHNKFLKLVTYEPGIRISDQGKQ